MAFALFASSAALCAATLGLALALAARAGALRRPWGEQPKAVHRAVDIGGALAGTVLAVAVFAAA